MLITTLPLEIFIEIFKYIEEDYETLYSCVLVNKKWHNINIPTLWRNLLIFKNSIKILINCLLEEYKNFLVENDIVLKDFELLEKSPLYNYAKFTTELDFYEINECLENLCDIVSLKYLKTRLEEFILDHSNIRKLKILDSEELLDHHRFDACFQNLHELYCFMHSSSKFIDKLATTCKNIQVLNIDCYFNPDYSVTEFFSLTELIKLIKAQNPN